MQMTPSPKSRNLITSAYPAVGTERGDHFAYGGFDPYHMQPGGSLEVTAPDRGDQGLLVAVKKPARILLVDAARALQESHLLLLRSIPAVVETLASCADMYLHEEHNYALVILVLYSKSRETAEAAHFVRHRWSSARILLLEGGPVVIDDWLYDERIDPHLHPGKVRDAALRLMAEEKYRIPGCTPKGSSPML